MTMFNMKEPDAKSLLNKPSTVEWFPYKHEITPVQDAQTGTSWECSRIITTCGEKTSWKHKQIEHWR